MTEVIDGYDRRVEVALLMMGEAATMDDEDRRAVERAAAKYFWNWCGMDFSGTQGGEDWSPAALPAAGLGGGENARREVE